MTMGIGGNLLMSLLDVVTMSQAFMDEGYYTAGLAGISLEIINGSAHSDDVLLVISVSHGSH